MGTRSTLFQLIKLYNRSLKRQKNFLFYKLYIDFRSELGQGRSSIKWLFR